jgi:hypothetical protein
LHHTAKRIENGLGGEVLGWNQVDEMLLSSFFLLFENTISIPIANYRGSMYALFVEWQISWDRLLRGVWRATAGITSVSKHSWKALSCEVDSNEDKCKPFAGYHVEHQIHCVSERLLVRGGWS